MSFTSKASNSSDNFSDSHNHLKQSHFPAASDPRIRVASILFVYVLLGITVLGFNRSPMQVLIIVGAACTMDMLFCWLINKRFLFPLSALITGLGLSILVNTSHGLWLPLIPVFCAIASKYLITIHSKHIYNPALFGLVIGSLVSNGLIAPSPAYQWGGIDSIAVFIVTAALVLFVFNVKKNALILSFLLFYAINVAIRAWVTRWHVPPETIILGVVTSPAFYLFTFFMLTDPATSPSSKRGQILAGFCIAAIDLCLHQFFALYTYSKALLIVGAIGIVLFSSYRLTHPFSSNSTINFTFNELSSEQTGITTSGGNLLNEIDPRLQHISKWLLSVGDAVAVADVNQDGLQDMFLTHPLKDKNSRAALYLNTGDFQFKRHSIPALENYIDKPEKFGLPSGALWFDYDNDSDPDLLILTGYGKSKLLRNMFVETQTVKFIDVSKEHDLDEHTISLTANALDVNNDGNLDLIIGNAMQTLFENNPSKPLSIFKLPKAKFDGDRHMFNFMHRSWHNANNGGKNILLLNSDTRLTKKNNSSWGTDGTRWTIDIGTGDFNQDGRTDLYLANDFGPDQLLLNHNGTKFAEVKGRFSGEIGRDTYKGMNASIADLDGNGKQDIYVSNVHEPLQAEGSLLWMNNGNVDQKGANSFTDRSTAKNILNENRFGWGAAIGDINLDGKLDVVQANGMVSDNYDKQHDTCPDYWYWNAKIALTAPSVHGYADTWADLRGRCIFEKELNRIYLNQGDFFIDVADKAGWTKKGESRGIALVDLDNDGDLDAIVTRQFDQTSIYRNDKAHDNSIATTHSWLGLKLKGNGIECNRDALGTKIEIEYIEENKKRTQVRELRASNGFSAQGDSRVLFGLGEYTDDVTININWCGQLPSNRTVISTLNQYIEIKQ